VDRIEFVIARQRLPLGESDRVEPIINGTSLVETVALLEGQDYLPYAGLMPADLFAELQSRTFPVKKVLLGCCCGDYKCSQVCVEMDLQDETVIWRNFTSSNPSVVLNALGPFRFSREAFEEAVRRASVRDGPVRANEWPNEV